MSKNFQEYAYAIPSVFKNSHGNPMKVFLFSLLLIVSPYITCASELNANCQAVLALRDLSVVPPVSDDSFSTSTPGTITSFFFDGLAYKGKATRVFAWLGIPKEIGSHKKIPGIILIHGGGGTAFKEWVERWNDQGFAALSIAVEGQIDKRDTNAKQGTIPTGWKQHAFSGPYRTGIYGDSDKPLRDQWMYHAVADTILAHSLLRSHPNVNPENIGVMGISWGGVITSTVVGIDTRFAFGIPTYGCGCLANAGNQYGNALGNNMVYREIWDPIHYLPRATMPLLWQSWPEDKHFPLDCQALSYKRPPGPRLISLRPGMGHGHAPPWNHADSYAFAKSVIETGKPWCKQTVVTTKNGTAKASFNSSKPFETAVLVSTCNLGVTGSRHWVESPASLRYDNGLWTATAPLPKDTTAWFLNCKVGDLIASTDFQQITPKGNLLKVTPPPPDINQRLSN